MYLYFIKQTQKTKAMTLQDLTDNRDRIIRKIKFQITLATSENIKSIMSKMVAILPQFYAEKPTKANIDKITMKAITAYIKYGIKFTENQANVISDNYARKQKECMPSSLQF